VIRNSEMTGIGSATRKKMIAADACEMWSIFEMTKCAHHHPDPALVPSIDRLHLIFFPFATPTWPARHNDIPYAVCHATSDMLESMSGIFEFLSSKTSTQACPSESANSSLRLRGYLALLPCFEHGRALPTPPCNVTNRGSYFQSTAYASRR
jgi:hypothetical protein